ncbi:MAG: diguanylate cyclase domain-containing protein, partial [Mycobacteriales bacterium]
VVAASETSLVGGPVPAGLLPAGRAASVSDRTVGGVPEVVSSAPVQLGGWTSVTEQKVSAFRGLLQSRHDAAVAALLALLVATAIGLTVLNWRRTQALRSLADQALYDPLTGLPTRRALALRLGGARPRARRSGTVLALLFCDLDGFKAVNDRFGHSAGDAVLQEVAKRLAGCLREEDLVARIGGDEFVAVLEGLASAGHAEAFARRVRSAVGAAFDVNGVPVAVAVSVGVAVVPPTVVSEEDPLDLADAAMYQAKSSGEGYAVLTLGQRVAGLSGPRAGQPHP